LIKEAIRIEKCAAWTCNHRLCPRCSARVHAAYRKVIVEAVAEMTEPTLMVLKVYSNGLSTRALMNAMNRLDGGLQKFRRSAAFKHVRSCVGVKEVACVSLGGRRVLNVHVHLIVDAPLEALDRAELGRTWCRATGARNSAVGTATIVNKAAIVSYITKLRDRCPAPGTTRPLWLLRTLARGLRDRQLLVAWGVRATGRGRSTVSRRTTANAQSTSNDEFDDDGDGMLEDADTRVWRVHVRPKPPITWRVRVRSKPPVVWHVRVRPKSLRARE
jgi:hypothetical protein